MNQIGNRTAFIEFTFCGILEYMSTFKKIIEIA